MTSQRFIGGVGSFKITNEMQDRRPIHQGSRISIRVFSGQTIKDERMEMIKEGKDNVIIVERIIQKPLVQYPAGKMGPSSLIVVS